MTTKEKQNCTNNLFVINIGIITFIVGLVAGQFIKVVI